MQFVIKELSGKMKQLCTVPHLCKLRSNMISTNLYRRLNVCDSHSKSFLIFPTPSENVYQCVLNWTHDITLQVANPTAWKENVDRKKRTETWHLTQHYRPPIAISRQLEIKNHDRDWWLALERRSRVWELGLGSSSCRHFSFMLWSYNMYKLHTGLQTLASTLFLPYSFSKVQWSNQCGQ